MKKNIDVSDKFEKISLVCLVVIVVAIVTFGLLVVVPPLFSNSSGKLNEASREDSLEISKGLDRITEAITKLSNEYVEDLDYDKLIDGAISGLTEATGDPYTRYLTDEEYQELLVSGTEQYDGIGVHITYDKASDKIIILGLMPGSPALLNDVKVGDLIAKVEDTVVSYETYNECVDKIKGEKGTSVNITLIRGDEVLEKQIVRDNIDTNNVSSETLDGNIGYIKIWSFENEIYKQFKEAYDGLRNNNISGLIIDLRNNPGGLVNETVEIAKLLLPKCDIVRLVYKDGHERVYKCDGNNEINIPLVVLVNSTSASAAEILSGAIKDTGKGILIGNKTYGKGIVQSIEKLENRGALSITTSKYYTASGIEIHKNGIEPNITVDLPEELKNEIAIPKDKDTQLIKAIEYINSKK